MGSSARNFRVGVVCLLLASVLGGCADGPRALGPRPKIAGALAPDPAVDHGPAPLAVPVSGLLVAAKPALPPDKASPPPSSFDEPVDPFATPDETVGEYDPWESFNVAMFEVNRKIDKYALKPLARGYNWLVPDEAQRGVENLFHNIRTGPRLLNNLFQGKLKGAGTELGRFLLNSTFGLGGFFDVAKHMEMLTPDEDFGQTLGAYGVPPGPYLVIPLFPPFTLRDVTGYVVDLALDPINWLVFPLIEVRNVPSVISHPNRNTTTFAQLGSRSLFIVNERSLNLESFQGVEEATVDLYSAVRNAYLQKRAKAIRE